MASFAQVETRIVSSKVIQELMPAEQSGAFSPVYLGDLSVAERNALVEEDKDEVDFARPYRFAVSIPTGLTTANAGSWVIDGNYQNWVLQVQTQFAQSLSVTFQALRLSEGAEIYLIDEHQQILYGPLTSEMFEAGEDISTEVLPGKELTIFYRIPLTSPAPEPLTLKSIGYGYREGGPVFSYYRNVEARELTCHVNVSGGAGNCFRVEQRAVGRTLLNQSTALCTATLINNTNNDLDPLLLTADHCNAGIQNFANVSVRFFDYTGSNSLITFVGTTLRAATGLVSDESLLELNTVPQPRHGLFYLGWDRSPVPPARSTVLHHPAGTTMRISGDIDPSIANPNPEPFTNIGTMPVGSMWRFNTGDNVPGGDYGALEGGSSGSAMLNPAHRIVGSCTGGPSPVCVEGAFMNANIWFGRFDLSWGAGFAAWLDPAGAAPLTQNATFALLSGPTRIPCVGLMQDVRAPNINTSGTAVGNYTYNWRSSSNITITGSGADVMFHANGSCVGCPAWIECDILLPNECGGQLIARSVRRNLTWGLPSEADLKHTIFPFTNNNGPNVGPYNLICAYANYTITTSLANGAPVPSNASLVWTYTGPISGFGSNQGFGFTTNGPGFAVITCTVLGGTGCMAGYSKSFVFEIRYPCSSFMAVSDEQTILPHAKTDRLLVFPNPASDVTLVYLPEEFILEKTTLQVMDLHGKPVLTTNPESYYHPIQTSHLPNGQYYLLATDGTNRKHGRILVSKQ